MTPLYNVPTLKLCLWGYYRDTTMCREYSVDTHNTQGIIVIHNIATVVMVTYFLRCVFRVSLTFTVILPIYLMGTQLGFVTSVIYTTSLGLFR